MNSLLIEDKVNNLERFFNQSRILKNSIKKISRILSDILCYDLTSDGLNNVWDLHEQSNDATISAFCYRRLEFLLSVFKQISKLRFGKIYKIVYKWSNFIFNHTLPKRSSWYSTKITNSILVKITQAESTSFLFIQLDFTHVK